MTIVHTNTHTHTYIHTYIHTYMHTHRVYTLHMHTTCSIPNHIFISIVHSVYTIYTPGIHLGCGRGIGGRGASLMLISFDCGLGRFCFHASMSAHCPLEEF